MTDYKIDITQQAFLDIYECISFVKNVSKEAANDLYQEIMNSIRSLVEFPKKYPEINITRYLKSAKSQANQSI